MSETRPKARTSFSTSTAAEMFIESANGTLLAPQNARGAAHNDAPPC